ncbi:unnamed protein product [Dovyalis caffra]|uniref:DNA (cytosine-5-)-methyltransferase n=1 Tax=Dovyalis caffra TaxID=77055 RepID=A0AAV1STB3_9ROSI|nr:unnamed protein product [Dovyalis caffra]
MKSLSSPTESKSKSESKLKSGKVYESTSASRLAPPNNNVPSEIPKPNQLETTPTTRISLGRPHRIEPTQPSVSKEKHNRNVSRSKGSTRNVCADRKTFTRSPGAGNACMQIVATERKVLVDSSALRRSPRLRTGGLQIVVSERNVSGVLADTARLRRSPRLANGCVEFVVGKGRDFLKRKRAFYEMSRSTRNQNGRLDMQLALVQCLKAECSSEASSKGSPIACSSAKAKLGRCEKCGCQSVSSRISNSVGDLVDFEAKPLLLPCHEDSERETPLLLPSHGDNERETPLLLPSHGDNERETGIVKCDEGSSVFGEEQLRRSPSFDFANENYVINESSIKSCKCSSALDGDGNFEMKSCSSGMSDAEDVRPSKRVKICEENSDSGMSDEKLLRRSPRINSVIVAENGNINSAKKHSPKKNSGKERSSGKKQRKHEGNFSLIGDPVSDDEAQESDDDDDDEDKVVWNVECHYTQADIDGCIINLGDCVYVKGEGAKEHIGRILEFFRTTDRGEYFRVQWFYRAEDTVMKEAADFHDKKRGQESSSLHICDSLSATPSNTSLENMSNCGSYKAKLMLLDLFSGCGGMSTGLCLGAKVSCVDLVTRWALDSDESACESLKLNHPEAHVRNEAAEDFLELLKEWRKLCKRYKGNNIERTHKSRSMALSMSKPNENSSSDDDIAPGEYEVARLVDICYGKTDKRGKRGLKFKVHWKGHSTSEDTWEPIEGLSNCEEAIRDFVREGITSKILPLPTYQGDVDVICGGPPCQGISGYNRYRNVDSPLADERNVQIVVFMDIVQFLKPKYVLMENVVDILRFDKASFARYALSRLVHMKYQARLGTVAAGCYGLPQFRLRKLPQFPLPTHDVIVRYWPPPEFERNTVAYDEDQPRDDLEKATVLRDAISDLPDVVSPYPVTSNEIREEMAYDKPPETDFQQFIRSKRDGNGANFRDLPGVVVGADNVARRHPTKEQMLLPSGKPLVPDFALNFEGGKSRRPYGRLWWDETVSTVVTYPDLHSQAVIHPEQDRVLTVRECARLQGFPDYYRFRGTVKQRYRQIGNAVAVPVGRALGYTLGMAFQKRSGDDPLMTLPPKFSHSTNLQLAKSLFEKTE